MTDLTPDERRIVEWLRGQFHPGPSPLSIWDRLELAWLSLRWPSIVITSSARFYAEEIESLAHRKAEDETA